MGAPSKFPGEPVPTFTDWRQEALNARRKAPAWHTVAQGRRFYSRTVAAQLRAGRIPALQPGLWEVRYQATDVAGKYTLHIRYTGDDPAPAGAEA